MFHPWLQALIVHDVTTWLDASDGLRWVIVVGVAIWRGGVAGDDAGRIRAWVLERFGGW
jgi:hypothetical protein